MSALQSIPSFSVSVINIFVDPSSPPIHHFPYTALQPASDIQPFQGFQKSSLCSLENIEKTLQKTEGQAKTLIVYHYLLPITKKTKMKKTNENKDNYKAIVEPHLLTKNDVHVCLQCPFPGIEHTAS